MGIGQRLTYYREKKGLSISALARKCECSQSTISEIESGKLKNPSSKVIAAVASNLEISADTLLFGEPEKKSEKSVMFFRKYENLSEESKKTIAKIVDALDSDD